MATATGSGAAGVVLGVEATGRKLTCVALDRSTKAVLAKKTTTASKVLWDVLAPAEEAASEIHTVASECLAGAGQDWSNVGAVCICTPTAEHPQSHSDLQGALANKLPKDMPLAVHGSYAAALSSGTGGSLHGVVLMAGTSTVAYGHLDGGRATAKAAGWGHAFLDGGSSFDIGSRALAAVSKARDGRGADTILCDAVMQQLGFRKDEQLVRWAHGHDTQQRVIEVAALASVVIDVAARGDAVADTILKHGVGELFRSAKTVVTKLGLERSRQPFKLVLAGPLLEEGSLYTQYLLDALKESLPTADICYPVVEPAEAATWIACRQLPARQVGMATDGL